VPDEHKLNDDKKPDQRDAGLGRIIYNVDDETLKESQSEEKSARREVEIADKESFPASDPPGFSGGTTSKPC
jgi:hypothetical protein